MFDLQRITTQSLDLVSRVVDALVTNSGADDASIMVIGAHCRDLLHASFGRADLLRATSDVDIGIAVDGDARYRQGQDHVNEGLSRQCAEIGGGLQQ